MAVADPGSRVLEKMCAIIGSVNGGAVFVHESSAEASAITGVSVASSGVAMTSGEPNGMKAAAAGASGATVMGLLLSVNVIAPGGSQKCASTDCDIINSVNIAKNAFRIFIHLTSI